MSRFKNRVKRLHIKTHDYISADDLMILRDFFKARFDDANAKPEDFQEEAEQLEKLCKDEANQSNEETKQKLKELLEKTPLANTACLYRFSVKECQDYPNGIWSPKYMNSAYLMVISEAKNYFKSRKNNAT